ncbi:hypothetical protein V1524DRAFT_466913 [Lipomyces starkeyi]
MSLTNILAEILKDLTIERPDAQAVHVIQAIGSSSISKGQAFSMGSYAECYTDPTVDLIYIGTPQAFHKPFTLNARDGREAMWTRFFPLTQALQRVLHQDKIVSDIIRVFADFTLDMHVKSMGPESRLKNRVLGAGSLLDIGIYSLTWGLLCLDQNIAEKAEKPKVVSFQTLEQGVDIGSKGTIFIEGNGTSCPSFTFVPKNKDEEEKLFEFDNPGSGFFYESDAVALDIHARRMENAVMPWEETIRVLEVMDAIRYANGGLFPQDEE